MDGRREHQPPTKWMDEVVKISKFNLEQAIELLLNRKTYRGFVEDNGNDVAIR